jgi:hypothetical protein
VNAPHRHAYGWLDDVATAQQLRVPTSANPDHNTAFVNLMARDFPAGTTGEVAVSTGTTGETLLNLSLVEPGGTGNGNVYITLDKSIAADLSEVEIRYVAVEPPSARRGGRGKRLLRNAVDYYDHLGIARIQLTCAKSDGGYWWAVLGFVPDNASWEGLTTLFDNCFARFSDADPEQWEEARRIWANGPASFDLFAGLALAREMLRGSQWSGALDLNDPYRYDLLRDGD